MVSKMDSWDPLHISIALLELKTQCLAGSSTVYEKTQFYDHQRSITIYRIHVHKLKSFSPDSPVFLYARQSSVPVVALIFTSLCSVFLTLVNSIYTCCFLKRLSEVDCKLKEHLRGHKKRKQMKHRNKLLRGDRMGEGTDEVDGAKTTRISLSFPISTGLPSFSAQKHCPLSHPSSSSVVCDRDAPDGTAWNEESLRDKQLSRVSKSDCLPCPSSSTLPIDLTAPVSKNCKPTLSFSVAGSGPHFPTSALHTSAKMDYSRETSGAGLPKDYPEHSTTETAHILFNLSARAYQGQVTKDLENSKGKKRKGNSLHVELSLPLPSINPSSSSSSPPPLSPSSVSPLTLPPPSFHDSYRAMPKPELLCGVCHRLFSTASSLTVHMRLHRGGRVLSCRHCGKAFIHNKRLQSHEATCRQALPAFPIQPKQEPLEEGEVEVEKTGEDAAPKPCGHETGPGQPLKKGRGLHGHHAGALSHTSDLRDEDHFAKVVDGHIIYFCSVCERSYMTLSSLKRHSNVHSWRRKYPCHYCDKVFALAEYRTKHEVWHTGERRYQCIFCWEAFPTYYNLKTHQKAFHGISPGLISSEKTANGGYKQKVNALKLYRLLPMRSQKRPYKTYSQALADGLLDPDSSVSLPLPLDCSLPPALDTSELETFLKDIHPQNIKPDPDRFLIKTGTNECKNLTTPQTDLDAENSEKERSDVNLPGNSSGKVKTLKGSEAAVSSVITFGHSKPSVIMHSTSLPSSVIVQRKRVPSGDGKSPSETNQTTSKASQKQIKKHSQKEHTHAHSRWDVTNSNAEVAKIQKPTEKLHKGRKAHSKSEASKAVPISVGSDVKGNGPLCQITVRIGEEAIVKRSISETDLRRDKSPSLSKAKKNNIPHDDQREQRHTHHHHRKHHGHRSSSPEDREGEPKWKNPRLPGKVRKYFFRQEVREDRNEHDGEDNLWRPYYSYKPKRKALHMQKTKSWQRKMHYKRSLRLMRRAEKLMNHVNKEVDGVEEDKKDEVKEEETEVIHQKEIKDNTQSLSAPLIAEQKEEKKEDPGKLSSFPIASCQSSPSTQYTACSTAKQHWPGEKASECGSCGRWFSSSRKRDKHELTHLFEFVCLLCRASFPSQTKLEEHQKTNHPKNKPSSTSGSFDPQSAGKESVMDLGEAGDIMNRRIVEKGSPVRLGRRPLTRYTCSHCDKVCKTAAALNCHLKRHDLGTTAENTQQIPDVQSYNSVAPETQKDQSNDSNITCEHARPIPVINYPKMNSQNKENNESEGNEENRQRSTCESPKAAFDKKHSPHLCTTSSPVRLSPTLESSKVASPGLPSVLVMNGAECLDFRTPEKRSLDAQDQRRKTFTPTERPSQVCQIQMVPNVPEGDPPICKALQSVNCSVLNQQVETDTQRHIDIHTGGHLNNSQEAQDLRVFPISRVACSNQAEDLSMQTILARERERAQQTAHHSSVNKKRSANAEVTLVVPKEEPLSPVPSPTCSVIQTTPKAPSLRPSHSPCHSPSPLNLQLRPHFQSNQSYQGTHSAEKKRSTLSVSSGRCSEPPSSRAILHPQVSHSEVETKDSTSSAARDARRESGYPVQEFALPLIIPGGYCSGKKQEDQILMSYPPGPLSFGALGKMVPHTDSSKLPFYPDPYHLLYGPQILPYPYNLAALPMALNMMASGDKVEPLPFLPTLFNYAAAGAPFTGTMPHPLVVNPSLYNSSSSSSTKRDSGNP